MNLVIDIGNSRIKLALFNDHDLMFSVPLDELKTDQLQILIQEHPQLNRAILSAVRSYPEEIRKFLQSTFPGFIEFGHQTPAPIINLYNSPSTLGYDRLAAAIGASSLFPAENLLVIDAGTAITYDLVTAENEFLGGNISPGLGTRFRALNEFTGRLPLIPPSISFSPLGRDTESAIRAGVQMGIIFEMEQTIAYFNSLYKKLKVVLTGGDAAFFEKTIKSPIFVQFNLALFGLNKVLEHNT